MRTTQAPLGASLALLVTTLFIGCQAALPSLEPTSAPTSFIASSQPTVTQQPTATPQPVASPEAQSIEGTYSTSFTRADLEASPLLIDQGEVNDENWGDWTLTLEDGHIGYTQRNNVKSTSSSGTFVVSGDVITMTFTVGENAGETFAYRWDVNGDELTLVRDDSLHQVAPTPFLIRSWIRTPALSSQPPATSEPLPAALRYRWVGETRALPGVTPPAVESSMKIDAGRLTFYATEDWDHPLATSVASVDASGDVRLVFESGTAPCAQGDEGTYNFDLSPTERSLEVQAVSDTCAQRVEAITGSWTRSACPNDHLCLGDLDPGNHVSVLYTPLTPFGDWHYDYGQFGYTVPEDWTNPEDNPDGYVLLPVGAPDGTGIYVFSDVLAHEQALDPVNHHCVGKPASDVGSSAVAIHDWINSLDGLQVTGDDLNIEVGGLTGYSMDLAVNPAWAGTCGWPGELPGVPLFVNAQSTPQEGFDWGINGDIRMRLFLLDLGPARTLLIDVEAPDKAGWDALVADAMPIVQSFDFGRTSELASGGNVFPGTYHTQFEPAMTLTIDNVVALDCFPGYQCRGDIDVNLSNWVGFEFGNVHGSEFNVIRLDQVFDLQSPDELRDPPIDLAGWASRLPGITVVDRGGAVTVGGLPASQMDLLSGADPVPFGPTGLTGADEPQWFGLPPNTETRLIALKVDGKTILITEQLGIENTVGDFDTAVSGLQPLLDSIVWAD